MDRFLTYLSGMHLDPKLEAAITAGYKIMHYIPKFETIHALPKLTYKVAGNLKHFMERPEISNFIIPELYASETRFDAAYRLMGILARVLTFGDTTNLGPGDSLYEVVTARMSKTPADFTFRVSDHREVARNSVHAELADGTVQWKSNTSSFMQVSLVVDSGMNTRSFDRSLPVNLIEVVIDPMKFICNENLEHLLDTLATIVTLKRKTPDTVYRILTNELSGLATVDMCKCK